MVLLGQHLLCECEIRRRCQWGWRGTPYAGLQETRQGGVEGPCRFAGGAMGRAVHDVVLTAERVSGAQQFDRIFFAGLRWHAAALRLLCTTDRRTTSAPLVFPSWCLRTWCGDTPGGGSPYAPGGGVTHC